MTLAAQGFDVVITARSGDALGVVAAECRSVGAGAEVVPGDVASLAHVEEVATRAIARFGGIDVWVNNAALLMFGRLDECPPEAIRRLVDVNLVGYLFGAHVALRHFRAAGSGTLVNVGSLLGAFSSRYAGVYVATKHAVEGLAAALRQEVRDVPDVHVCNVLPAAVDSPILDHAANFTGHVVKPLYPLADPWDVSAAILRCIDRPRATVLVGRLGRVQHALHHLVPATHDRIVARLTGAARRRADPAPIYEGSLYRSRGLAPVSAGSRRKRRVRILLAGTIALWIRRRLR